MYKRILGYILAGLVAFLPMVAHAQLENYGIYFQNYAKPETYGQLLVQVKGDLQPRPIRVIFSSNEGISDWESDCVKSQYQVSCPVDEEVGYFITEAVVNRMAQEGTQVCVHLDYPNTTFFERCVDFQNTGTPFPYPTPEQTAEASPEPTGEATGEPTEEATAEPTEEPTPEPTDEATAEPTEEVTVEPTEDEWTPAPVETPDVTSTVVITWTMAPPVELTEEPTEQVGEAPVIPTGTPTPVPSQAPTEEPTEEATAEPTEGLTTELPVEGTPAVVTPQPPTAGETKEQPQEFELALPALFR